MTSGCCPSYIPNGDGSTRRDRRRRHARPISAPRSLVSAPARRPATCTTMYNPIQGTPNPGPEIPSLQHHHPPIPLHMQTGCMGQTRPPRVLPRRHPAAASHASRAAPGRGRFSSAARPPSWSAGRCRPHGKPGCLAATPCHGPGSGLLTSAVSDTRLSPSSAAEALSAPVGAPYRVPWVRRAPADSSPARAKGVGRGCLGIAEYESRLPVAASIGGRPLPLAQSRPARQMRAAARRMSTC